MAHDYEKYRNLVYKLSRKAYARLCEAGCEGIVEFDDIVGEANIAFVKASNGYREDSGAQFITYLHSSITFNLSHYIRGLIADSRQEVSADKLAGDILDDEEGGDYYSLCPSPDLPPDELISRKQQFGENMRKLRARSNLAFEVARNVIELTPVVEQQFDAMVAQQRREFAEGTRAGAPRTELGLRFIVDALVGNDRRTRKRVVDDIKTVYKDLLDPELRF